MWIYIFMITVSTFFAFIDQKRKRKAKVIINKKTYNCVGFFGWMAIIIPTFIAGARDYTVGSDTQGYGIHVFDVALNSSFEEFFRSSNEYVRNVEVLYRVFVYIIAKIFENVFWQFFIIQFIICLLVYITLNNLQNNKYAWLGYYIYLTFFYGFSLNLMRQSISMAIILWGFKFVKDRKLPQYIVVIIIATLIQLMSIIGVFIYPLYYICCGEVKTHINWINKLFNRHRKFMNALLVMGSCLVIFLTPKLILLFSVLKGSYGYQLVYMNKAYNPSITVLILMIITIIPFVLQYRKGIRLDKEFNFYTMILVMSTILWQITGISRESYRVALPLWFILVIAIPHIIEKIKKRCAIIIYYLVAGGFYFFILFITKGVNEIYPYTSTLLRAGK